MLNFVGNHTPYKAASIVVIVPLRSIAEDQLMSNDFDLRVVAYNEQQDLLGDIASVTQISLS